MNPHVLDRDSNYSQNPQTSVSMGIHKNTSLHTHYSQNAKRNFKLECFTCRRNDSITHCTINETATRQPLTSTSQKRLTGSVSPLSASRSPRFTLPAKPQTHVEPQFSLTTKSYTPKMPAVSAHDMRNICFNLTVSTPPRIKLHYRPRITSSFLN